MEALWLCSTTNEHAAWVSLSKTSLSFERHRQGDQSQVSSSEFGASNFSFLSSFEL